MAARGNVIRRILLAEALGLFCVDRLLGLATAVRRVETGVDALLLELVSCGFVCLGRLALDSVGLAQLVLDLNELDGIQPTVGNRILFIAVDEEEVVTRSDMPRAFA